MTTESTFDCVFCKEVFDDKETLLVHFRKHGDPNFNSNAKNKSRPQNETPATEKSPEEVEVVGCDVCDEVFPTISKAITHKHKAHPDHDAKYFCSFCGKLFTMKHLYNKHIQSNHETSEVTSSKEFHCDSCVVIFSLPSAMLYHNKFFHRQDTDLPALGQSTKVKTYNQVLIQIYYCAFCGEEYNNKVNLHKHMGDDHEDENQSPTEILRCPLCEAIFYHLDAYEIHLTFHSTDDLYSEQNELVKSVAEFSLETVPPIMEKVEEDANNTINNEGIDNFLQLVMGESADNDVPGKVKSKKHKKHKKSKKASITLDEFLNMNKDVFGDGLDVQGIEEVPTQVVLKKVKGKKMVTKNEPKKVNADLAKLKKQGIVVKTKSRVNPILTNLKKEENKPKVVSTPNEILSKLMNQGNSQIKVVKKTVSQDYAKEEDTNNIQTSKVSEPCNVDINKDINSEHSDERTENILKISDNHIDECEMNENSEKKDVLQEKDKTIKFDAESPFESDDISFKNQDLREKLKNNDNTNLETKDDGDIDDAEILTTLKEQDTSASSPRQSFLFKTSVAAKQDSITDHNLNDQEAPKVDNKDSNSENDEHNLTNKTLDALKHLSHLITVKSVSQIKPANGSKTKEKNGNDDIDIKNVDNDFDMIKQNPMEQNITKSTPLTKLGERITIKPTKQPPSLPSFNSGVENEDSEFNGDNENDISGEFDKIHETKTIIKSLSDIKTLNIKNISVSKDKNLIKNESHDEIINEECHTKATNLDILKRLTNVTAKPIGTSTKINQKSGIKQANITHIKEVLPKNLGKSNIDEEVEIFNIDDSDSEEDDNDTCNDKVEETPSNITLATLQNLGKNIVVKSNQQNVTLGDHKEKRPDNETTRPDFGGDSIRLKKQTSDIQRSINLQNKLKVLGGNVTVKSRNSSPNLYNKEPFRSFEDYDDDYEGNDSGSESNTGRVKITEINEDDISDHECNESQFNAIVESPNVSNSENEDVENELTDIESQIKSNALKKENSTPVIAKQTGLENLKNLNKELTIKSINTKKQEPDDEQNVLQQKETSEDVPTVNKQMTIKLKKPNSSQSDQSISKSSHQASGSQAQTFNKNVSTSSNQVNTVKTVKRFQSQTVIEEITTTVTKTIRTVNQSTNEVVQNRNPSKPIIRPQKIINKQPGKELQGTSVRHASPTIGTKIRNATSAVRNPNPNIVRPSNQLVPVRPHLNMPRAASPSTSGVRKVVPPRCSPQKPIGKLKISPHALNQATKRPSDEAPGPFSCFKKPRDSLADMSDIDEDSAGGTMQLSMATQSRSDFASITKTIKGKGMVTATQTRSEVSTSSKQQLNRLSNVSGLKIMKSSAKQATHVEQKCEISTTNKSTLDAIERLQKQGLLIKKPRTEDYNDQPNSFSGSDDEVNDNH